MPSVPFANEAEWLALRESRVGGSEIASLFNQWHLPDGSAVVLHAYEAPPEGAEFGLCLSSYLPSYRLFQQKAGVLKPSFEENERMTAGKFLEPALAAWAQQKWDDMKLRKTQRYLDHETVEGWGCSLDYELVAAGEGYPPVEFKNVDWLIWRDQWGAGEDGDIVPPIHINLQLQAQIGVTKASYGWIVVCVGGNKLERVRVERHEPTQARLAEAISLFWAAVQRGQAPDWLADYKTVSELATISVQAGDNVPPVDLSDNEAARVDAARFMRINAHAKFVAGHLDRIKARLGLHMTDRTRATFGQEVGDLQVGWPITTRAAMMIPARWQEEKTYRMGLTVRPKPAPKPKAPSKKKKAATDE